ncbi:MAG: hypothetical protein IMZ61_04635 [Planctomycetes bacterium]|nr:hypothetical protein [Planctomycetota bacterium]
MVDVNAAIDLKVNHGLSLSQIGAIQGVSKQAVHQAIKAILPEKEYIEPFKANRADILAHIQAKAAVTYLSLDEADQKKLLMRRGLVDMGIAYDKERLERDLSTANVAYDAVGSRQEMAELRALLGNKAVDKPSCQPIRVTEVAAGDITS